MKFRDIFNAYCSLQYDILSILENDHVFQVGGDFGEDGQMNNGIFFNENTGADEEYVCYYFDSYLCLVEDQKPAKMDLFNFKDLRCLKLTYSILKRCDCIKVSYNKEEEELSVMLPITPSYEELEDIRDTFKELYDILSRHK